MATRNAKRNAEHAIPEGKECRAGKCFRVEPRFVQEKKMLPCACASSREPEVSTVYDKQDPAIV